MLIDSHAHVQFPEFDADRDAVVKRALEARIWMVNVGTNVESSKKAVELAHQYPDGIYATVGVHPHDAETDYDFARIEELVRDPKVVGIGETGLDYAVFVREQSERLQKRASAEAESEGGLPQEEIKQQKEKQKELFIRHIELAQKVNKPLLIHCREAHDDLLEILQIQYGEVQLPTTSSFSSFGHHIATNSSEIGESQRAEVEPRGVMHFFGGEGAWENLGAYLKMGFYISLAGVITFSNYKDADKIKKIPPERILIETDAPFVAPEPFRGKRNEPLYVKYVAEKLANILGVDFDEMEDKTTANAKGLFRFA